MKKLKFFLLLFVIFNAFSVYASAPQRIISTAPSFTEILFALGLNKEIVGTTNYCDYPTEAKQTEKIGDAITPDLEKIVALHPDLVLVGQWKWKVPENLR